MKIFLLILLAWPLFALSEPVMPTTPTEGARLAPLIGVAEVITTEYHELGEGQSVSKMFPEVFWIKYRIIEPLKGKLKVNQELTALQKTNSCIAHVGQVLKKSNKLTYRYGDNPKEQMEITRYLDSYDNGTRFILFMNEDLTHFGDALSPMPWSKESYNQIRSLLSTQ